MDSVATVQTSSGLLSLPTEILEDILGLVVSQAPATITPSHGSFERFFNLRKEHRRSSPYNIRFTCKRIDEAMVGQLFREVTIRLGWNRWSVNPPFKQLAEEEMGSVFRENARVLHLDQILVQDFRVFEDDLHRDHPRNGRLPTDVWYHYPEPMTRDEKIQKYEDLMEEVRLLLPAAIASMPKLLEIRCQFDMRSSSNWLRSAISQGLSTLSSVEKIYINIWPPSTPTEYSDASLGKHFQEAIPAMKNLQAFELSIFSNCRVPSSWADELWLAMQASKIKLRFVSVDRVSQSLLTYLASFTGLRHLSLSSSQQGGSEFNDGQAGMASVVFNVVLGQHCQTLLHLALPCVRDVANSCWSLSDHNIAAVARCQFLTDLTVPLHLTGLGVQEIGKALELLLDHIRSLPLLLNLTLRVYAHRLGAMTSQKCWLAFHDALLEIQFTDKALVPSVINVAYNGTSRRSTYSLLEGQSQSGDKTWQYDVDRPDRWKFWRRRASQGYEYGDNGGDCSDDYPQEPREVSAEIIDARLRYAEEQKAKGVFPGDF